MGPLQSNLQDVSGARVEIATGEYPNKDNEISVPKHSQLWGAASQQLEAISVPWRKKNDEREWLTLV
jgi:hypothetical protein